MSTGITGDCPLLFWPQIRLARQLAAYTEIRGSSRVEDEAQLAQFVAERYPVPEPLSPSSASRQPQQTSGYPDSWTVEVSTARKVFRDFARSVPTVEQHPQFVQWKSRRSETGNQARVHRSSPPGTHPFLQELALPQTTLHQSDQDQESQKKLYLSDAVSLQS